VLRWLPKSLVPHPVTVLRGLRNGMLLSIVAAALLYLWVAVEARHDIAAVHRTQQAIGSIQEAGTEAVQAQAALKAVVQKEDPALTGTGTVYVNDITQVSKEITFAAEYNSAGAAGTSQIQYVSGELETYLELSENTVLDYSLGKSFGSAAEAYAQVGEQHLTEALGVVPTCQQLASAKLLGSVPPGLAATEMNAECAQLTAWPLDPGTFWWILLGPVIVMMLLVMATAYVLARHFRRHIEAWLWGALLTAAATSITVGAFNVLDERHLSGSQLAGNAVAITVVLLIFAGVCAQTYLAYHDRLAEYKLRSS
jgi:hypothetical protein